MHMGIFFIINFRKKSYSKTQNATIGYTFLLEKLMRIKTHVKISIYINKSGFVIFNQYF